MKSTNILYLSFGLFMALCPLFLNSYWTDVFNNVGLYTILALSLNVILGHAGLFHMGHAAFYAIGAYTAAILNTMFGIPVLWIMPLAGIRCRLTDILIADWVPNRIASPAAA